MYQDLKSFLQLLKQHNELATVHELIDPVLEITEFSKIGLEKNAPALLFTNPKSTQKIPVLTNLFSKPSRIMLALGCNSIEDIKELGKFLAILRSPSPPSGLKELLSNLPLYKKILSYPVKTVKNSYKEVPLNLHELPIQTCWPKDAGPLITWGMVITKGPNKKRQNIGIYRQQVIGKNKVIMRWLAHRGGALDYKEHIQKYPGKPFPIVVALGCDPALTLAAVMPIPDNLSEFSFAGLLRNARTRVCKTETELFIPADAQIVLHGHIMPNETAPEGPFGDHTGYYNEVETFPVVTFTKMSICNEPIYHSTYTGKPPDEPAVLGQVLNELFIPILQQQFSEVVDFYMPPEGCSYRIGILAIKKKYPGHGRQIMLGIWSFLRQFMYTKWLIVVDEDIDIRNFKDVLWAVSTRMDPKRDVLILDKMPIDYLDFSAQNSSLGSRIGFDATNKCTKEAQRQWGDVIKSDTTVKSKMYDLWHQVFAKS